MRHSWLALATVVVSGMGCDSQEPDTNINVAGDWLFSYTFHHPDIGGPCSAADIPLTVQQDDSTFTGTQGEYEQHCTGPNLAGSGTLTVPVGQVVDGMVRGTEVAFKIDLDPGTLKTYDGAGDSTSLSGTFMWVTHISGSTNVTITRAGSWAAVRPPQP